MRPRTHVESHPAPREDRPLCRPEGPDYVGCCRPSGCTDIAKLGAVRRHEGMRHRTADADDENEPRERSEELLHLDQG
jgi:hypothetical protein